VDLHKVNLLCSKAFHRTLHLGDPRLCTLRPDLRCNEERIPQLQNSYRRASEELKTAFLDIQFRFERARAEGDLHRQLAALQATLALCAEDRLPICTDQERTYQQLHERQLMR
jgi:hypothetical protein